MTERNTPPAKARTAAPRPSLTRTVLGLTAAATAAAALVWSALFIDLLAKRGAAASAPAAPAAHVAVPNAGQPAQTLAPVTTRTS
jgi:hypothetical protein